MYKGRKIIAIAPAFNEEKKITEVVSRVPKEIVDKILIVDDGSTDKTCQYAIENGAEVICLGKTIGVGAAIRAGFEYAINNQFDIAVVMAGNNKDSPEEIPLLLEPICENNADFVQGSRYLKKNANYGSMPLYRRFATRLHPLIFSFVSGLKVTESTNGFRAIKVSVLSDQRLNLNPTWLDNYELEPYLYLKVIELGYKTTEVPVTKIYPPKSLGYTKMVPIISWWSIMKPLVYYALRIRR